MSSLRLPFWSLAALIVAAHVWTSRAHAEDDPWLAKDKALHFGVSAALSASGYGVSSIWLEHPGFRCLAGGGFALGVGAAKEAWDAAGHGDPSIRDFTWDVVGAVTGVALALGVDLTLRRLRHRPLAFEPGLLRF
jgi:putative lipoprotein